MVPHATFALLTVPALAAAPLHKVTFRESGVTKNHPASFIDFVGHNIQFNGEATQAGAGTWQGKGDFTDTTLNLKAHLVVDDGTIFSLNAPGTNVWLTGLADVTLDRKQKVGTYPFFLVLVPEDITGPQVYDLYGGNPFFEEWFLEGTTAHNSRLILK